MFFPFMIGTILKHIAFLLLAPLAVGAIVFSPLIVREVSNVVEAQKKPRLVTLYDEEAENTLPPCEF